MTSIRIICRLTAAEPHFPGGRLPRDRAPEPLLKRGPQHGGKKEVADRQRQTTGTDRYRQNRAGSARDDSQKTSAAGTDRYWQNRAGSVKDDSQKTSAAETGGNRQNRAGSVKDDSQKTSAAGTDRYRQNRAGNAKDDSQKTSAVGTDRYRQNRAGNVKDDSQKTSAAGTDRYRQNRAGSVKDGSQRMPVFRPNPRKTFCGRMHAEFTVKVEGHSGYAPYGQDLVCAGVSMLTFTLAAATGCRIEAESGRAVLHFRGHIRQLYTVLCGFVLLSRTYPDYVRIKPLVRLDSLGGSA